MTVSEESNPYSAPSSPIESTQSSIRSPEPKVAARSIFLSWETWLRPAYNLILAGVAGLVISSFTTACSAAADHRPPQPKISQGIWAGHDVARSSQQAVHILQFGGDVDLLHASRQAVAAADAGRAVPRQGGVFLPRTVKVVIIPGIPLVAEDV